MTAEAPRLRPLTWGQTIDVALRLTFGNFKPLAVILAIIWLPIAVVELAYPMLTADELVMIDRQPQFIYFGQDALDRANLITGVLVIVGILAAAVAALVMMKVVADAYLSGEPQEWRPAMRYGLGRLLALLWILLLLVLAFLGAAFVFGFLSVALGPFAFIPLLAFLMWVYVRWWLSLPALVVEDERGVQTLNRSAALVKGRWWPTFGSFILMVVIFVAINLGIEALLFPILGLDNAVLFLGVAFVVTTVGNFVVYPLLAAVPIVVYYDLRVRKEGLDLQLMQLSLDPSSAPIPGISSIPPPPAPPPPSSADPLEAFLSGAGPPSNQSPGDSPPPPPADIGSPPEPPPAEGSPPRPPRAAPRVSPGGTFVECPGCGRTVSRVHTTCPFCAVSLAGFPADGGDDPDRG